MAKRRMGWYDCSVPYGSLLMSLIFCRLVGQPCGSVCLILNSEAIGKGFQRDFLIEDDFAQHCEKSGQSCCGRCPALH